MIHPQAIVDPSAELAEDVEVGPWTLIGPNVSIDSGSVIASHVVIKGPTSIGKHNRIFQFATVGEDTPDMKYQGEPTRLEIGDHNVIREGVTIHRGTVQDRGYTRLGNHNLLMAYAHVGHDSVVGDHAIMVNNAALAGHVEVGDWAILGGYCLIHQFCKIGAHSFIGMGSVVGKDVPAYMMINGNPAEARGINQEGLRRRGFSNAAMTAIKQAYKVIYRQGNYLDEAVDILQAQLAEHPELAVLVESLQDSGRGIIR